MRPMEFACTIGFDALRISMGGKPRHHDVDTICRWLRHVSAQGIEARQGRGEDSVNESPVGSADAPDQSPQPTAKAKSTEQESAA